MKKMIFLFLNAIMLSGCAGTPEMFRVAPAESYDVIVIDMLPERPVHAHTGTTIFNNKDIPIEGLGWDIGKDLSTRIGELLHKSSRVSSVKFANKQQVERIPNDIQAMGWSNVTLDREAVPAFTLLRNETNADIAIVLMPIQLKPDWQLNRVASGYGLYTRCFADICQARTFMHLHPFVVDLRSMQLAMNTSYIRKSGIKEELEPINLSDDVDVDKALSGEQKMYIEPHYNYFVDSMMLKVRAHLEASGVLEDSAELKLGGVSGK